jgi:hypothetical protein
MLSSQNNDEGPITSHLQQVILSLHIFNETNDQVDNDSRHEYESNSMKDVNRILYKAVYVMDR